MQLSQQPLGIFGQIDQMVALYRTSFRRAFKAAVLSIVITYGVGFVLIVPLLMGGDLAAAMNISGGDPYTLLVSFAVEGFGVAFLLVVLLMAYVQTAMQCFVMRAIADELSGEGSLREALGSSWRPGLRLLACNVLIVFAFGVVFGFIAAASGMQAPDPAALAAGQASAPWGLIGLLVAFALLVFSMLLVTVPMIVLEHRGVGETFRLAMRTGFSGTGLRTALMLLILTVVFMIAMIFLGVLMGIFLVASGGAEAMAEGGQEPSLLATLFNVILAALLMPLAPCLGLVIRNDDRMRRGEGPVPLGDRPPAVDPDDRAGPDGGGFQA